MVTFMQSVRQGLRAVIDADSHVTEPRDLFTSRVSSKFGDLVPYVLFDEAAEEDAWYIGAQKVAPAWGNAAVGFEQRWPAIPA
ncbi:MAG: hypothetical protein ABSH29_26030 [Acidimicrobiales bacterium]|jgi:hypothetical protein